jgi:hypothetical protein
LILSIEDPKNMLRDDFADWLLQQIQINCLVALPLKKSAIWNTYLNTSEDIPRVYDTLNLDVNTLIKTGIQNIVCERHSTTIVYKIDRRQQVFGLKNMSIESVCKLINYGNQSIDGTYFFTNVFKEIQDNIDDYIDRYIIVGI